MRTTLRMKCTNCGKQFDWSTGSGFMEQTMGGLVFRGVGMIRAKANIALTNLVYNMCRLVQIKKYHPNFIVIQ